MELINTFDVSVPVDTAWAVLTDVERIAPCLPGAQLQEIEGDEYRGIVKVKVGPITAQYKGKATFLEKDDVNHKAVLDASGRDTRGQGNASATITAQLEPNGDGTTVTVTTDLTVTGKVAQFGRGVLADVSAKLLDQFVNNLEATVLADELVGEAAADLIVAATTHDSRVAGAALDEAAELLDVAEAVESVIDHTPVGEGAEPILRRIESPEVEPVDLLDTAGSPVLKRAAPLLVAIAVVLVLLGLRRRRRRSH